MSTRKALGKGIAALIPESPPEGGEKILSLSLDEILPSPWQPRRTIDPEKISELAKSIQESGLLQPITVRRTPAGFELVAGERRWRASREAGQTHVDAIVREVTDAEALMLSLIENIQRDDLNPIEEAQGYARIAEEFNLSQEEIAQKMGKDRATVANFLRLLKLPEEVRKEIQKGTLSAGHGRSLLALEGAPAQREIARLVISKGLSVRAVEELIHRMKTGKKKTVGPLTPLEAQIRHVVEELKRKLRVRVEIQGRGKKGKLVIHYSSEEELARVVDQILT
ncbi:MAG: ParB/RepB/Spo0J family partition protein [Proteobacteria bacterium]|nr:ParB/RepB/Spo0J family partition protein [Pseudomonadota bacterium]